MLTGLAESVVDVLDRLGYLGVTLLIAAENLFPPIPSEVILPLCGLLVAQGRMSFPLALAAATLGSLIGAVALYWLGALVGQERLRVWIDRLPLLDTSDADRGREWFERYGGRAVFVGRLVPVVRSVISLPAGVERMPMARFVTYTVVGSAIWNTLLIGAGWMLGERWELIKEWLSRYQLLVIVLIGITVVAFLVQRLRRARASG